VVERAIRRASRRGRHAVSTELHPWVLSGHPDALERAVLKPLDNAIKFSAPDSTVEVRRHEGLLEITDQGPGIPRAGRLRSRRAAGRTCTRTALSGDFTLRRGQRTVRTQARQGAHVRHVTTGSIHTDRGKSTSNTPIEW
jgi:histidine kinase/DNA gyrase B/HSP90-like ATPase